MKFSLLNIKSRLCFPGQQLAFQPWKKKKEKPQETGLRLQMSAKVKSKKNFCKKTRVKGHPPLIRPHPSPRALVFRSRNGERKMQGGHISSSTYAGVFCVPAGWVWPSPRIIKRPPEQGSHVPAACWKCCLAHSISNLGYLQNEATWRELKPHQGSS